MKKLVQYVPFHVPTIGEEEIREVEAVLRSGWLTTGPRTALFEQRFREYAGARHALALSSATAGLHLALAALGIGPGDEVITTPLTFCSTVHSILHLGAIPVLADISSDFNIDPESIRKRITRKTRAILPVHFAGLPCHMDAIWEIAREHGLAVVEDAAHAAGAQYNQRTIGSSQEPASDAVVFSFYATKNLTTGEGGMLTTPNESLADKARALALHGMSRDAWSRYAKEGSWYYEVVSTGFKYNLSDIQSAIGIHQLAKLESFTQLRSQYAALYSSLLAEIEEVQVPPSRPDSRHAWHLYVLRLNLEKVTLDRKEFIHLLGERGVGCSVHFVPIPLHPYFSGLGLDRFECPRALELYPRILSLPLYPAMTIDQVRNVAQVVADVIRDVRKRKLFAMDGVAPVVPSSPAMTRLNRPAQAREPEGSAGETSIAAAVATLPMDLFPGNGRTQLDCVSAASVRGTVLADFMSMRGRQVFQGCGRMWHSVEGRFLISCPYHERFSPEPGEIAELLRSSNSRGVRFSSLTWAGESSGVYLYQKSTFGIDHLHASFRQRVRKGFKNLEVRPVERRELLQQGLQANLDSLARQGRFDSEFGTRKGWDRLVDAAYNCPGISVVGAFAGKSLAAYMILSREGRALQILHQMSKADYLRCSPNHVLTYEVTRCGVEDNDIDLISYGLASLVDQTGLHDYKSQFGYELSQHYSVVVLHPHFAFLRSDLIRSVVSMLRRRRPADQRLEKVESVLRMAAASSPAPYQHSVPVGMQVQTKESERTG